MRRFGKSIVKENRGEIMLESSIIMVLVLTLLMALLAIGFLFYQQAVMTSVASELSSSIAKNYKYHYLHFKTDAFTVEAESEENAKDTREHKKYRLTLGKYKLEEIFDGKAESIGMERVKLSTLGFSSDNVEANCEIVITGIGRAYAKVTVTDNTEFFLSSLLKNLHIYDGEGFSAVSYAECTDMTGYASLVNFSDYIATFLEPFGEIGNIYQTFGEIIDILKG